MKHISSPTDIVGSGHCQQKGVRFQSDGPTAISAAFFPLLVFSEDEVPLQCTV